MKHNTYRSHQRSRSKIVYWGGGQGVLSPYLHVLFHLSHFQLSYNVSSSIVVRSFSNLCLRLLYISSLSVISSSLQESDVFGSTCMMLSILAHPSRWVYWRPNNYLLHINIRNKSELKKLDQTENHSVVLGN